MFARSLFPLAQLTVPRPRTAVFWISDSDERATLGVAEPGTDSLKGLIAAQKRGSARPRMMLSALDFV